MNTITNLPIFSQIKLDHVESDLTALLANNVSQLKNLLAQTALYSWENLMLPLEDMQDALQKLWMPVSHLYNVTDSEELRILYKSCMLKLSDYHIGMMQNVELFHAVESITTNPEFNALSMAQKKIIANALRDFKLAGVHLEPQVKKRFADLNQTLSQLSAHFEENLLDATQAWTYHTTDSSKLSGLPKMALAAAENAAKQKNLDGWLFTLEAPSYMAVMTYADSAELRQDMYFAYLTRASDRGPHAGKWDNTTIMADILTARHEIAQLLGFNNYAEYSLATKMAKNPEEVIQFLQKLSHASLEKAQQEFAELQQFTTKNYGITQLNAWDVSYYSEKLRQQAYNVSKEAFRPYFPDTHVIAGLFTIIHHLYGVVFQEIENPDVWDKQVRLFAMYEAPYEATVCSSDLKETGKLRGYLYIDLYARNGTRDGAWMNDAYSRRKLANGAIQVPVGFVNCNFNAPLGNDPALLTHDDVTTLFHECGHALQHLLTTVDEASVAGISGIPWDAVEIASQFMENWCWEKAGIDLIAQHYQTRESLPVDLFDKLTKAKNFQSAMQMVRQLQFALFDFRLHLEYDPTKTNQTGGSLLRNSCQIQQILDEIRADLFIFPVPEWNRFQHGFSHIFAGGYAAGYYSYKWAEVLACDAFSLFEEKGIFDHKTGEAFLHTFLESGGVREPMDLFIEFRGRPPEIEALLRHDGIL